MINPSEQDVDRLGEALANNDSKKIRDYYNKFHPRPKTGNQYDNRMPERFFEKIVVGIGGCWTWVGALTRGNYGMIRAMGEQRAHRVSFRIHYGPIPEGTHVLHRCDNRQCVNPEHLFLGTHSDNMIDMWSKGRSNRKHVRGEDHHKTTLSKKEVAYIRKKVRAGCTRVSMARKFNVSPSTVGRIVANKSWL